MCSSDLARFLQIYEVQAEQEVRDVQILPSVRRGLAQLAESMNTWRLAIQAPAQPAGQLAAHPAAAPATPALTQNTH